MPGHFPVVNRDERAHFMIRTCLSLMIIVSCRCETDHCVIQHRRLCSTSRHHIVPAFLEPDGDGWTRRTAARHLCDRIRPYGDVPHSIAVNASAGRTFRTFCLI